MNRKKIRAEAAEHWADLSPEVRGAIVAQAEDRLWWEGTKERLRRLGPWASWATVIIGGFVLFKDQLIALAALIAKLGGPKP